MEMEMENVVRSRYPRYYPRSPKSACSTISFEQASKVDSARTNPGRRWVDDGI